MDIIQLLPDSVANQIAAGEVIQRPASVIKELVENAIDAGAKHIQVLVSDAGKASIQVIDDGCGMSDTDARLSFERHATSKIRQAVDLFDLHTMGFRGEALASIAAVAQVTLQSRREEDELGTRLVIAGSKVMEQENVSCPVGSNFLIENLFFNIPARRKFLKSNSTEMNQIMQTFERIVLVYPEIDFTLYNNGMEMLRLRSATHKQRIIDVFGKRVNQQLLPVEADTTLCKITGFIGKPESAKKKGANQFFFVNGRYMRHPYFHKAVMSAYDRLLPEGEQVSYFIYFDVNPADIDVNIHPVKTEIKFDNEQAIWQVLMASVRDAVGKFSDVSTLDFDSEGKPDIPVFNPTGNQGITAPQLNYNPSYNPFSDSTSKPAPPSSGKSSSRPVGATPAQGMRSARGWEELFSVPSSDQSSFVSGGELRQSSIFGDDDTQFVDVSSSSSPDSRVGEGNDMVTGRSSLHYQLHGRYILTEVQEGLMMIDQHRASVRVLYDEYMHNFKERVTNTQKILFPEMMQFPPSFSASLDLVLDELRLLGFDISDLGGGNYALQGVPPGLDGLDPLSLVNNLVSEAVEHGGGVTEKVNDIIALTLAKRAAVPYGEFLSNETMEKLVTQLFECAMQRYTPDGKIIINLLQNDDLERRF